MSENDRRNGNGFYPLMEPKSLSPLEQERQRWSNKTEKKDGGNVATTGRDTKTADESQK